MWIVPGCNEDRALIRISSSPDAAIDRSRFRSFQYYLTRIALFIITSAIALFLTACGVTSAPGSSGNPGSGNLLPSATSVDFGSVNVGSNATKSVTVTNNGDARIGITQISVAGSQFSLSSNSSFTLDAAQQATVSFRFAPTAAGAATGTASISTDTPSVALSIQLTGTGLSTGTAQLTASPSSVSFGTVATGSQNSKTVTLGNYGAVSVTINSASYTGAAFSVSGLTTPLTLSAGQSSAFTVSFNPSSDGSSSGSITFVDRSGTTLLTVPLSGTAATAASHYVDLSWTASASTVAGYRIYRGGVSGGPYTLLSNTLVSGTTFRDSTVLGGSTYFYVVTAVDSTGAESGYSNQVTAAIPLP